MAFFGLTALGPQNTFEDALPSQRMLHLFDENDFKKAFDQVSDGRGFVLTSEISYVLKVLYHGPAPDADHQQLLTFIGDTEVIEWENLRSGYLKIQTELKLNQEERKSNKCSSYSQYKDLAHRHVRADVGPNDKFTKPLTAGQEFGWNIHDVVGPVEIKGRKSCPETIYAHELAKSGIIY